jgi:DedD protein
VSGQLTEAQERPGTSAARVGLLLGGVVLAAVVIFGLGVMEGSRIAGLVPDVSAPPNALPTETIRPLPAAPATAPAPLNPDKLTFYDRLSGVAPPAPVPLPAAQPPAEAATVGTAPQKSDPAAQIRKLAGQGRFTVQVAAVNDRSAAAETAALVKRNGFEAATVAASVKGKTWYRIRVGHFPSRQAASQAAGIFRSAFGLDAIPAEQ